MPATSAIAKVVAVLESLPDADRLGRIADAAGLPPSTTHRILSELVELGWAHVEDRTYVAGPRLLSIARRLDTDAALTRLASAPLRRLCDRTGYTAHFAVRHGDAAVYALKLEGRRAYLLRSRVGDTVALHRSAIGKSVLARLGNDEVREIAARTGLPRATDATLTDVDALLADLTLVRRRGWAIDEGENEDHTRCVGAAVVDASGRPLGGVSLSALTFDLPRDVAQRLSERVVETARDISAVLSG